MTRTKDHLAIMPNEIIKTRNNIEKIFGNRRTKNAEREWKENSCKQEALILKLI